VERHGRRLRVLYLIDSAVDSGGAERFALGLALNLPRDRFDVWMCSTRFAEPSVLEAFDEAGLTLVNLGRNATWQVHRFRGLAQLLRRQKFDVLHSHMFGSNVWGTVFGRACGVPVIIAHEHNWSYSGEPARVWIDRHLIGRFATRFVAVSRAQRELMVSVERIPLEKIVVLPTAYLPSKKGSDTDLPEDAVLIGTAAILRVEKALDNLIEAHALLIGRVENAHLVIAGHGDCLEALERRAAELGISDRVHFLGRRTDVDSILRGLDVGAMSSDWEGMPLFVFECMAAHTALVATSVGGIPEVVENGATGLLVPPRDPVALADALAGLLSDPARREQLARAAAERLEEFTIASVALRFASLYEQLLGLAPDAPDRVPVVPLVP
jgi:glycosyltransferase involved in cell wall biosynthesis